MLKKIYHKLPYNIQNYVNKAASRLIGSHEDDFISSDSGKNYGLTKNDKIKIIDRLRFNFRKIDSATSLVSHIELMKKILSLSNQSNDTIVECGCFKGATSISLSIVAKITNRKLIIYDSFEGLPNDDEDIKERYYPHISYTGNYEKGMYTGNLNEVLSNITIYGEKDSVELRKGFFNQSLKQHNEKIDFLFLDVDLISSTKDCILNLWNYINDDSYIYTDDACDIDVAKIWFDDTWWEKNLSQKSPGYVGSGCGIPLNNNFSSMGYTIKNPNLSKFIKPDWLR